MGQVINTNSLSLLTQNNLNKSQSMLNTSIQRLSSGLRINSAKDDAAGQAIANRFSANIKGLSQAQRNANDGISLAQTTEGALNEVNTNLQRIRELAVQSATGSNSADDKASIQAEITQRLAEIDRTSAQTDFNGVKVLSSSAKELSVQVGANDGETIKIGLSEISSKTLGLTGFNVDGSGSSNTAASKDGLVLAGYTRGTTAGDVTTYTNATGNTNVTSAQLYAKAADTETATVGTAVYTYSAAKSAFTFNEAARTNANTIASLTPPAGTTKAATVNIDGTSMDVKIASNGNLTTTGDAALFIDASGNLTQTSAGTTSAATLTTLTASMSGATSSATTGGTITVGSTVYTAGATTTAVFGVAGDEISSAALQVKNAGLAQSVTFGGQTSTISTAGATNAYTDVAGTLGTSPSASLYLHNSTGVVSNNAGTAVFADSANSGKFTLNAKSGAAATIDPLNALDAALSKVDKLRGSLGAVQNRFDSVISNLGSTITNLSSSRSRIEDADYATEVSNMTRAQILQQAGTSVLAKANSSTEGVMSLLR